MSEQASRMSSQVVDKIFDTGFEWFKKIESMNQRVIANVKEMGTKSAGSARDVVEPNAPLLGPGYSAWTRGLYQAASVAGLGAAGFLLFKLGCKIIPEAPAHLKQGDKRCVLLFGQTRDPITRQIVMDLYRRGFVLFVCSEHGAVQNDDDGLFHIKHEDLHNVVKYLQEENSTLSSILIVPNSAYYPSGAITTLSSTVVQTELEQNVFTHMRALLKLLPHLNCKLQILMFTPSLPQHFGIPHHSAEYFVSGLMRSFYYAIKNEYPRVSTYLCHLGILKIAGSPSNFKYLSLNGSNMNSSLLTPLYRLIISSSSWWLRLREAFSGSQRFFGKGSWIGYYLGRWLPPSVLKLL